MWRKPATILLPAVLVLAGATGLAGPSAPAAAAAAAGIKGSSKVDKIPAAVLRAVQNTSTASGPVTDGSVHTDDRGRVELDFNAARPTGGAEEADLARSAPPPSRAWNCLPSSTSPRA